MLSSCYLVVNTERAFRSLARCLLSAQVMERSSKVSVARPISSVTPSSFRGVLKDVGVFGHFHHESEVAKKLGFENGANLRDRIK